MARHHLAVALLPPPRLAAEVDVLRRALGSGSTERIPPHLTLVPPVNVRGEQLAAVHGILDAAATAAGPVELRVGPVATFAPRTPTVHLEVRGATDADDAQLRALRDGLLDGPLDRPEEFAFAPHVTLGRRVDPDRIDAAVLALDAAEASWSVRSVFLLEHRRPEDRSPFWEPVREVPFGPPVVVGRGGVELRLRTVTMLGPAEAEAFGTDPIGPLDAPAGATPLVVTATAGGPDAAPCGVAVGEVLGGGVARLRSVVVDAAHRRVGVGSRLLAAWCSDAAVGGAEVLLADAGEGVGFLSRHGFVAVGEVMVRR